MTISGWWDVLCVAVAAAPRKWGRLSFPRIRSFYPATFGQAITSAFGHLTMAKTRRASHCSFCGKSTRPSNQMDISTVSFVSGIASGRKRCNSRFVTSIAPETRCLWITLDPQFHTSTQKLEKSTRPRFSLPYLAQAITRLWRRSLRRT